MSMAEQLAAGPRGRELLFNLLMGCGEQLRLVHAVMKVVKSDDTQTALSELLREMQQVSLPAEFSDDTLTHAVKASVENAMYWQPPDEEEAVFQYPEVRAALPPAGPTVARVVCGGRRTPSDTYVPK